MFPCLPQYSGLPLVASASGRKGSQAGKDSGIAELRFGLSQFGKAFTEMPTRKGGTATANLVKKVQSLTR